MRVHWLGERAHNTEVVLVDKDMGMVNVAVVVLGSNWIGIGVNEDHMVVNGEKELVNVVVRSYVERMAYKHRVGLVGNYKVVHHVYWLGMHYRMVFVYDILEGVVA